MKDGVVEKSYPISTAKKGVGNISGSNIIASGNVFASQAVSATGNVIGGNVTTTGIVSASGNVTTAARLVSTVAVGTAPIVVTSTTEVANLFVFKSNIAGYVTAAAQG